jgi:hypothetical protein
MNTFNIISKSFKNFIKNPFILVPFLIEYVLLLILTISSYYILENYLYISPVLTLIWLGVIFLLALFIGSFFMASIIGICGKVSQDKKILFKDIILFGKKFWLKNLALIFIILISTAAVFGISFLIGTLANRVFSLQVSTLIYIAVFFIGILSFSIFFTFPNFYLIIYDMMIFESLKRSFSLVKKNYLSVLFLWAIFMGATYLINLIPLYFNNSSILSFISQLINTFFINPIIFLIFSLFIIKRTKQKFSEKRKKH